MKSLILMSILAVGLQAADLNTRVPVLAELFTSEGCSSCPPADALLMKLDRAQPVAGAQIIVLSEHVDYWNSDGWNDPFSSAQFTARQRTYAHSLVADSYTPQMLIDGRTEVLGNDEKAIQSAVAKAAKRSKLQVTIVSAKREGNEAVVNIAVGAAPGKGEVWIAIADDRDQSNVQRGENKGRTLNHVAVVRSLNKAGTVTKSAGLEKTLHVPLAAQTEGMRVVVFVAESGGPVMGSAMQELQ